ncbi:hypothetical protein H5410_055250 [Solanum commersonii]|uniref:Uncharacterized protein n=1 Tax=Solanum commersonii TaxID=4109 RepID=A0A9J5WIS8_SOLCO|nr:hypothetical protein H5410_055250 [Solanum commersonii]
MLLDIKVSLLRWPTPTLKIIIIFNSDLLVKEKKKYCGYNGFHIYYGKSGSLWGTRPKQACWIVQKILKAQKHIKEIGMTETDFLQIYTFSINVM